MDLLPLWISCRSTGVVDGVFGHLPGPVLLARPQGQSTTFSERDFRVEVEEEWLRSELGYQLGDGLGHRLVREWITEHQRLQRHRCILPEPTTLVGLDPDPTGLRLRTTDLGLVEASVETWPEEEICFTDRILISGGWQGGGFLPG